MALITCPECGHEISDQAISCPNCGMPLSANVCAPSDNGQELNDNSDAPVFDNPEDRKKGVHKKALIVAGVIIAAAILLIALYVGASNQVTAANVGYDSLYYPDLGVGVRIGQSKNKVDKLLGTPVEVYDSFQYDSYIYITYKDGKVDTMLIDYPNDRWITKAGISIETSADDVINKLGEPRQRIDDGKSWFYQNGNNVLGLYMNADKVSGILIYNAHGMTLYTQEQLDEQASPSESPKNK